MSEPDHLTEAIVDALERGQHTHKSLRETVSADLDCSEEAVSRAITALHEAGVIEHERGFFELATD